MTQRFIKVDYNFPDHPKTVELTDRAFRQLIEAWCFSARTGCDGKLTSAQARRLFSPTVLSELVRIQYVDRTDDGYQMHDYTDHQMAASELQERHEKRVAAGQRGGRAKARASKPLANASPIGSPLSEQSSSKRLPEVEVEEEEEVLPTDVGSTNTSLTPQATRSAFDRFWDAYPRKVGKDDAYRSFTRALKRIRLPDLLEATQRLAADPNLPDRQFIPYPATWLNRGQWADDPYPPRTNGHTLNGADHTRALAERYAAEDPR